MESKSLEIKIGKSESEAEQMINDLKDFYQKIHNFLSKPSQNHVTAPENPQTHL